MINEGYLMKKSFPAIFLLILVLVIALPVFTRDNAPRKNLPHNSSSHNDSGYWVVNMADNKTLTHTSVPLSVGDEYITADNKIYRITIIIKTRPTSRSWNKVSNPISCGIFSRNDKDAGAHDGEPKHLLEQEFQPDAF
jgi:hypothetical protein